MRIRPPWWPPDYTVEQLGCSVMGKHYEHAMYAVFAADCEVLFRSLNREEAKPKPDGYHPFRVQLWVVNSRVTNYEIG